MPLYAFEYSIHMFYRWKTFFPTFFSLLSPLFSYGKDLTFDKKICILFM